MLTALIALTLTLVVFGALAATADPIVCSIELDPDKLSSPGTVNVTITISNSGSVDMRDPVVLYDPSAKIVSDFGTNGSAVLKAGESKTWTGTCEVSQRMLDSGAIVYYAKYTLYTESGEAVPQSPAIRGVLGKQSAEVDLDVRRTITPTAAPEGKEITVKYELQNSGTVTLTDITIQENKDIYSKKQTIPELKPGQIAEIKYPVKMGKKDLTSGAKITYKSEKSSKTQTYTVENAKIINGESQLEATLKSSSKGVPVGEKITLTLTLKNKGSVAVSDLRVSDPLLGEVFAGQEVAAGKTLTLEKELTLEGTTSYSFSVNAVDASGNAVAAEAEAVTVSAVDPGDVLTLNVTATPDKTEVFESPGMVRFSLLISNPSAVDAANVTVKHGDTAIYTFEKIPAGESRKMTRDTALSMAGKYRFTVTAQDPLENNLSFSSNEIQIVFSVPTPPPATQTPAPDPTPEPTFSPVTMPPISDRSIGALPKTVQNVLLPILIIAGILLAASGVLLVIATKRRAEQRKAAEAALDHLERAKRRDYAAPADEPEAHEDAPKTMPVTSGADDDLPDYDLPPLGATSTAKEFDDYSGFGQGLYDEEMTSDLGRYTHKDVDDGGAYADDGYERDGYTEGLDGDGYAADDASYADDTAYTDADDGYADDGYSYDDGDASAYADDDAGYADDELDGHVPDDREDGLNIRRNGDDGRRAEGRGSRRSRAERGGDVGA